MRYAIIGGKVKEKDILAYVFKDLSIRDGSMDIIQVIFEVIV